MPYPRELRHSGSPSRGPERWFSDLGILSAAARETVCPAQSRRSCLPPAKNSLPNGTVPGRKPGLPIPLPAALHCPEAPEVYRCPPGSSPRNQYNSQLVHMQVQPPADPVQILCSF